MMFLLVINMIPNHFIPAAARKPADMLQLGSQWYGWLLLILLAAGPTLFGFGLYNISLGLLHSSTANLILTFEPVMTGIVAYFLLGERLTPLELFGSSLILIALCLLHANKPE